MSVKIEYLIILILVVSAEFCFAADAVIKIASNPKEAEIYVASDPNEQPRLIGKTPFEQDLESLINSYVKKNIFILTLKKEGFEDYKVLFTKATSVDIELQVNMIVDDKIKTIKKHDLLMNELFDVQRMIRGNNARDAILKLDELEKEYKHFSVVSELKATAYYMNKDMENALTYYRKSFALNPDNVDAYKMKIYLEKKMGVTADLK